MITTLRARIYQDMLAAQKARDAQRLSVLRILWNDIKLTEINERIQELDDGRTLQVLTRRLKQCEEARAQASQAGRPELEAQAQAERTILETYLPEPLSDAELDALIQQAIVEVGATQLKELGKVMAALKSKLQGRADMAAVTGKVKARLQAI